MFNLRLVPRRISESTRRLSVLARAASWFLILPSVAAVFDIVQITHNSIWDVSPAMSGSNVVWGGYDGKNSEIYLWDGES